MRELTDSATVHQADQLKVGTQKTDQYPLRTCVTHSRMKNTNDVEYGNLTDYPGYRVGSDGSVWSAWVHRGGRWPCAISDVWRPLRLAPDSDGYPCVGLYRVGQRRRTVKVSVLVLTAFRGPRPHGFECCHNNGVRTDSHLDNLRWDTRAGNRADRILHGTETRGELSARARLDRGQVLEIRRAVASGAIPKELAATYGVSLSAIYSIASRQCWAWLADE